MQVHSGNFQGCDLKKSVVIVREVWTRSLLDWSELDCIAVYEVKVYLIEM